ncbi:MAG: hypothetical protein GYB20_00385 [Oceanospirillales bacterium]|nr:hypothetical protein [Oceanospirillales bacterium]MBR9886144.1 hypothetical protein [Oceanospirillales bacterium]
MNKFIAGLLMLPLLVIIPLQATAGVGPESSIGELYQDRFHYPLVPTVPFYVHAANGEGSKVVWAKVPDIRYYRDNDGDLMFYAGTTEVCSAFSVTGSIGDSDRRCLSSETVPLIRPAGYSYQYCVFRTDGDCGRYLKSDSVYPLKYQIAVVKRMAESDSFNYANVVFTKTIELSHCSECEAKNWSVPKVH